MPVHQAVYERLKDVGRSGRTTYYGEVAPLAGLDMATEVGRIRIAQILDDINIQEDAEGRPMLSAVVILKEQNMPGAGFFECARGLRRYLGSNDDEDRVAFWISELKRVHNYWILH